jgi:hypothetical protein
VISNLQIYPASVPQRQGVTASVGILFDFQDSTGSLAKVRLTAGGTFQDSVLTGMSGKTSGSIKGTISLSTNNAGAFPFSVQAVTEAGMASNSLASTLDVTPPAPIILSIRPVAVQAGGPGCTLTVTGIGFDGFSSVVFNGTVLPTTLVSSSQVTAEIPAPLLAVAGTFQVAVQSLDKTATSNLLSMQVATYQAVLGTLPTNDVLWDPVHAALYGSIPASSPTAGNTIGVFDPATGSLLSSTPAAAEPGRLALSDDGQFLYVSLSSFAIQRFRLPALTPDLTIPLGQAFPGSPWTDIFDLAVAPGAPGTLAVALHPGLALFDDGNPRVTLPINPFTNAVTAMAWNLDGKVLYGANFLSSRFDLSVFSVGLGAPSQLADYPFTFKDFSNRIHWCAPKGLVYSDGGEAVDPGTGKVVGSFSLVKQINGWLKGQLALDAEHHRAFFLVQDLVTSTFWVQACDLDSFATLDAQPIPGYASVYITPSRILRIPSGLAIGGGGAPLCLVSGSLVTGP